MGLLISVISALVLQSLPAASTQGTAVVGRVVVAGTGEALPDAAVVVQGGARSTVKTDAEGRFRVTGLMSTDVMIVVTKAGFISNGWRPPQASRTASSDSPDASAVRDVGDIALDRGRAIGGLVLDEQGRPVARAHVVVTRARYMGPGQRTFSTDGTAATNGNGEYRVEGLVPGNYFVSAQGPDANASTYYPGTITASDALTIRVVAGLDTLGIDVRLQPAPLATVSGTVTSASGRSSESFAVIAWPAALGSGITRVDQLLAEVGADGRFTIPRVPPGDFFVEAISKSRLEAIARSGQSVAGMAESESGSVRTRVDGHDVPELTIVAAPLTAVSGSVTLDGKPLTSRVATGLQLMITDTSGVMIWHTSSGTVNADGTFSLGAVPGRRLLRLSGGGLGSTMAVQRTDVFGLDATDDGFDVDARAVTGVSVALTSRVSRVSGVVMTGDTPQEGARVVIFSAQERDWTLWATRRVTSVASTRDGAFDVTALPAGDYYAIALPTLTDGLWAEPDNLRALIVRATAFTLSDGEQKTLTLKLR